MTTMLEKAAMAAAGCTEQEWLDDREQYRDAWRESARAALQAIREPDTEVVEAGMIAGQFTGYADLAFTAMIDAILSEGEA